MPSRRREVRAHARRRRAERRAQALAAAVLVAAVVVTVLTLTAFGPAATTTQAQVAGPVTRLGPTRPSSEVIATYGVLRIQLPIAQARVTAIGFHGAGPNALRLDPNGRQGNRGVLGRLRDALFGRDESSLVYYRLRGGDGPPTSAVDVGAAPRTEVFAPVDGTVIAIAPYELDGRRRGVRVDIEPTTAPSLVVSITRLRRDPLLTVGAPVAAGRSRLGAVLDLARWEHQELARYTQDAGNHVTIEVRPAATLLR